MFSHGVQQIQLPIVYFSEFGNIIYKETGMKRKFKWIGQRKKVNLLATVMGNDVNILKPSKKWCSGYRNPL